MLARPALFQIAKSVIRVEKLALYVIITIIQIAAVVNHAHSKIVYHATHHRDNAFLVHNHTFCSKKCVLSVKYNFVRNVFLK